MTLSFFVRLVSWSPLCLRSLHLLQAVFSRRCKNGQRNPPSFCVGLRECTCALCLRHGGVSDRRQAVTRMDASVVTGTPFYGSTAPFPGSSAPAYLAGQLH